MKIHKHHHLFVCIHEKRYCTKLTDHIDGKKMIKLVDVPGNRHPVLLHRELTRLARNLTKELLAWMLGFHSLDLAFDGQFSAEHLYVSSAGRIKIEASQKKSLRPLTPEGRRNDRLRVAETIEFTLLSEANGVPAAIPHDVRHLLDLLKNGKDTDDFVLARHTAGMTDTEKIALFSELFAQVESLELRDPEAYERVINSLPYHTEWIQLIEIHHYLTDVYFWRNRQISYTVKPSCMLKLKRNSLGHLVSKSVKVRVRRIKVDDQVTTEERHVEVKFKFSQIAHMFSFTFPQVTAILQLSLHREGELEGLYSSDDE